MDDVKFEREDRYAVFKFSDIDEAQMRILQDTICRLPRRQCVVVESDWPEYGPVWQSIERRVTGNDLPAAETMGYSVFGNRYMIALTQQEILDHSQSYAGCMFELVARSELDAQRLRADTAEAALIATKDKYQRDVYGLNNDGDPIGGYPAGGYVNEILSLRLKLAHALELLKDAASYTRHPDYDWNQSFAIEVDAALNPKPEAGSHE